jgi:hypothetical protein
MLLNGYVSTLLLNIFIGAITSFRLLVNVLNILQFNKFKVLAMQACQIVLISNIYSL